MTDADNTVVRITGFAWGTAFRALAAMPLPTEKRQQGESEVAVQIQGVWVRPGDWLYADGDGMVVAAERL